MQFLSKARAFARAPLAAVPSGTIAGAALGLALGGVYLAGGMAHSAADPGMAPQLAGLAQGSSTETTANVQAPRPGAQPGPSAQVSVSGAMTALRGASDPQPFQNAVVDRAREIDCLAQAVYYEARGESPAGQAAVAQVVLNRTRHPAFPSSVCGVVFQGAQRAKGCQFSFACDGSLRRRRDSAAWNRAKRLATRAMEGKLSAGVGSATHFHVTGVQPGWTNLMRVAQVGAHVFYKFSGRSTARPVLAKDEPDVLDLAADASTDGAKIILTTAPSAPTADTPIQGPALVTAPDVAAPAPPKPEAKPAKAEPAAPRLDKPMIVNEVVLPAKPA